MHNRGENFSLKNFYLFKLPSCALKVLCESKCLWFLLWWDIVGRDHWARRGFLMHNPNSELKFIPELWIRNLGENFSLKKFYLFKIVAVHPRCICENYICGVPITARRVVAPYNTMFEIRRNQRLPLRGSCHRRWLKVSFPHGCCAKYKDTTRQLRYHPPRRGGLNDAWNLHKSKAPLPKGSCHEVTEGYARRAIQ